MRDILTRLLTFRDLKVFDNMKTINLKSISLPKSFGRLNWLRNRFTRVQMWNHHHQQVLKPAQNRKP